MPKNPYGMRISVDRIERLTAHASIRTTVKTLPMIRPSGRSMQFSTRVYANTSSRSPQYAANTYRCSRQRASVAASAADRINTSTPVA